jgi:glycerol 2-dehydrogenase (NADP+)
MAAILKKINYRQDMQKEVQLGRVKNIGVSNFGIRNLKKLLSHPLCSITPAVNQLEVRKD